MLRPAFARDLLLLAVERRERFLEGFDRGIDLRLLALAEHARDHFPKLHLGDVEIPALTLHPDAAHDAPSKELAERHAHRAARELQNMTQIFGAERLG